jgi:hypothetical protein
MRTKTLPLWLSFSTAHRRDLFPATLSEALIRLRLVYPLASFDVSGQWPVYHTAAWPNEDYSSYISVIHPPLYDCQEAGKKLYKIHKQGNKQSGDKIYAIPTFSSPRNNNIQFHQ